ncbi:MAG: hypothetical protein LBR15_01070 [Methanobrevibacter sp.]|jgi:hypothetical protein|nr:hypothetical protein [Candidatus Methanovirga australis]
MNTAKITTSMHISKADILSTLNNNKNPIDDFSLLILLTGTQKRGYICPGNPNILTHTWKNTKNRERHILHHSMFTMPI